MDCKRWRSKIGTFTYARSKACRLALIDAALSLRELHSPFSFFKPPLGSAFVLYRFFFFLRCSVNLDPNVRNISKLRSWPEFHNGVAAGLRLAPFQGKMARTWIQYNKPVEPNYTHAGLLLALGLHGHLSVLTIADVYRYLSQEVEEEQRLLEEKGQAGSMEAEGRARAAKAGASLASVDNRECESGSMYTYWDILPLKIKDVHANKPKD